MPRSDITRILSHITILKSKYFSCTQSSINDVTNYQLLVNRPRLWNTFMFFLVAALSPLLLPEPSLAIGKVDIILSRTPGFYGPQIPQYDENGFQITCNLVFGQKKIIQFSREENSNQENKKYDKLNYLRALVIDILKHYLLHYKPRRHLWTTLKDFFD